MSDTCISCYAPLKPGAKFCTQCGVPQNTPANETLVCVACKKEIKPESKFCTFCGSPQTSDRSTANLSESNATPNISIYKQKIVWNVQPGEIAHRINETELMRYDSAQGIIINEGTTAYIKANGKLVAQIHGGAYDFISHKELEEVLNTRIGGLSSQASAGFRFIANLILGKRIKDRINNPTDELRQLQSLDGVVEYLKKGALFSITLKLDKSFQLIFGAVHQTPDDYSDFIPMKVRTKYLDLDLGMRAFFKIESFDKFATHYLGENNSVTTRSLAHEITPLIQSCIQESIQDLEVRDSQIPTSVFSQIEQKLIQQSGLSLHGIILEKIVEITVANQDLERFRELSRELYLSDQELDYLHRTNEFKNRLTSEVAQQTVNEAQNELDLHKRMEEINKDRLLTESEFEKFYLVLSRERRIQEAQSNLTESQAQNVINNALVEIERTGLLREEETEILRFQIQERQYHRGYAVKLMQLKDAVEYEKARTGGEQEVEIQALMHQLEMTRREDDYQDSRFYKKIEMLTAQRRAEQQLSKEAQQAQNEQITFAYGIAERERQAQMDRLRQIEELDANVEDRASQRRMQEQKQVFDDKENERRSQQEELKIRKEMSAEQIMADKINAISEAAQVALATSLGKKDAEQERDLRKQQEEIMLKQEKLMREQKEDQDRRQKEENDRLERMMMQMLNTASNISGHIVQNQSDMKQEYRQELHHEQARGDQHQEQALNYITRNPQPSVDISGRSNNSPANSISTKQVLSQNICPNCSAVCNENESFCLNCGSKL